MRPETIGCHYLESIRSFWNYVRLERDNKIEMIQTESTVKRCSTILARSPIYVFTETIRSAIFPLCKELSFVVHIVYFFSFSMSPRR